jgi:menaquinone-dependent protoporphyrinogen IX oxidase
LNVLVLYFTKTGHTLEAARATAEGIRSAGSEADVVAIGDLDAAALKTCDALIVASPCWAGSFGRPMFAPSISRALRALAADALQGKRCAGISVHAAYGAENTVNAIGDLLAQKGCTDYRAGPVARAGVPFSLWVGPPVSPEDEARFRAFGAAFVQ